MPVPATISFVDRAIASGDLAQLEQALELLSDENVLRLSSIEKGRILKFIKEKKLYKADGTFRAFCERVGYSVNYANKLIQAISSTGTNGPASDQPPPKTEGEARRRRKEARQPPPKPEPKPEYVAEEPDEEGVWEPAEEVGEPLTNEDEEDLEREGRESDLLKDAWQIAKEINTVRQDLEQVIRHVNDVDWSPDPGLANAPLKATRFLIEQVEELTRALRGL